MPSHDSVLKNGHVVSPGGVIRADIGIRDGIISAIGSIAASDGGEVTDCTGLHILPGVIDTQVHFREPGLTHKEDLESGSLAAVMGGVTAVFEMPNTSPATVDAAAFNAKIAAAKGRMHCDHAFFIGGTHDNAADLGELERLPGCAGIKVFMGSSTGSLLVEDDGGVREILRHTGRRAAFHAEDEARLRARKHLRVPGDAASHPVWRDVEAAFLCTRRLVAIAEEEGKRIHVLHVSTAEEMEFLARHKHVATVEVTPNHLTFDGDTDYARLGTLLQMNPPVRGAAHRRALWRGVQDGTADIIGSDHAPHTLEEKSRPYPESPSGMTGVQTLLPVMLHHVAAGRLSLERLADMTAAGPARVFDISGKGRIAAGYDADFSIVDTARKMTINNAWIRSRAGWTPFDGFRLQGGWPVGTIIGGKKVMWEGELLAAGQGRPVRFAGTRK